LAPFAIALVSLGAREIWLNMRGARQKLELDAVKKVSGPIHTVPAQEQYPDKKPVPADHVR
jgi:hypothetical protein